MLSPRFVNEQEWQVAGGGAFTQTQGAVRDTLLDGGVVVIVIVVYLFHYCHLLVSFSSLLLHYIPFHCIELS